MKDDPSTLNRRILVIDDQEPIHADFRKILAGGAVDDLEFASARAALFGPASAPKPARFVHPAYELEFAFQGQEGLERVRAAKACGKPFAVAFVDMRMPPGWDGLETIRHLWRESEDLEVVICTAYSDYSWEEVVERLGNPERLLILKKPFDTIEVAQLANALTEKWNVTKAARFKLADIARMVEERTHELATAHDELLKVNAELVEAYRVAEAANKSKGDFLAGVGHEIRTPMTAICGYAELIQDSSPPTQQFIEEQLPGYLGIIVRNSRHLGRLIDDLLDLSKIEAGKLEIERGPCSPIVLLEEVRSLMAVRASEKQLSLKVEIEGRMPETIQTDMLRLRQILFNLLSNAIKFTDHGSVRIIARLIGDAPEPLIQIDVVDTGIGMSEEQINRLFRPYVQADASVSRRFGGTGMGLAISRRLAEMLGGSLVVTSRLNAGSVFRVSVASGPLDGIKMIDDPTAIVDVPVKPVMAVAGPSLNCDVLLAEDGEDNQRLIRVILEKAGARVTLVADGQQAINAVHSAAAQGHAFDVILMDMQMPVLDGFETTRRLREQGYRRSIVALTAHALTTARSECLACGCNDYIRKPIDRRTLIAAVAQWTKAGRDARPVAAGV